MFSKIKDPSTPFLSLDLDILESNISIIKNYLSDRNCRWRPHCKAHKCPSIAHLQIKAGAIGITCAKLSEAEIMVANGINNILLANQIVSDEKWLRLASLQKEAEVIVSIDDSEVLDAAQKACQILDVKIPIIIELDIGMGRVGISNLDIVVEIAGQIKLYDRLIFRGIMGYEGHVLDLEPSSAKQNACQKAINTLLKARDLLDRKSIHCEIISAGGTGSYEYTSNIKGITELQAGGGIFMDRKYREEFHVHNLNMALHLQTSVTSRRTGQIVTDAGFKAISAYHGEPIVTNWPDLDLKYLSAEHGVWVLNETAELPPLGHQLSLVPGYTDSTTMLHRNFYGFRNGVLESVLPISAAGCLD
ncbi:MAG: alanine racemase [Candidatus Latescibacterota bacterium]|nr:alanine racemase [Candidatus Latescibacterota bacterium]